MCSWFVYCVKGWGWVWGQEQWDGVGMGTSSCPPCNFLLWSSLMAVSVLLCDSMCKRVTCCMAGVHLSVHHVHVLHRTAKDIVKLLSIILVSCYLGSQPCHPVLPNSKRKPLSGGVKYRGGVGFCNFWLKLPFVLQGYLIGHRLLWNVNSKS